VERKDVYDIKIPVKIPNNEHILNFIVSPQGSINSSKMSVFTSDVVSGVKGRLSTRGAFEKFPIDSFVSSRLVLKKESVKGGSVNSYRYKFCSIKYLLLANTIDMMIIAETKLDETFPNSQFEVENDHLWRADRSSHGLRPAYCN
jgi:hypothetical protein